MSPSKSAGSTTFLGLIPLGLLHLETCQHATVLTKDKPLNSLPDTEGIIGDGETSDLSHPGSPPLLQTVALKAIEAHYPQCLQYHPSQITQMDPDVLDEAGDIKKKHV